MQALHNIMADLGLASETPAPAAETNKTPETSDTAATAASGSGSHDKTAAEEVKDEAITHEADPERTPSREITTNTEEAHLRPTPPALISRDTAGTTTTDGADDNASMLPLGKGGRPLDTPMNESRAITPAPNSAPSTIAEDEDAVPAYITSPSTDNDATGTKHHLPSSLTRSTSVMIAPSREEIDAAKSAIIMAVASCPVHREVSFSDTDNGTDTGRLEVRQVLKGYKGIDAAIKEMNRDVKITVLNANPMSSNAARETFGLRNNDGEGNASFAKAGSVTPSYESTSNMPPSNNNESRGLASAAPIHSKTTSDPESIPSQNTALASAPTSPTRPTAGEKRSSTFMPTSPGKPGLDRLNTLQREELEKVPNVEGNREVEAEKATPALASERSAAPTEEVAAAPATEPTAVSETTPSVPAATEETAALSSGARVKRSNSLAQRLRAEVDERARASREGRPVRELDSTSPSSPTASQGVSVPAAIEEKETDTQQAAAPTVMTDLTPEPMSTGPASSVSAGTETSKPSAFTEEFDKSAPAATPIEEKTPAVETSAADTPASTSTPVVATSSSSPTTKEAPKVSYASTNGNGNRRQSKDAKSGGFLSGLFRRKSQKVESPSKANGVSPSAVSEPSKTAPVVEKEQEKEIPTSTTSGAIAEESPLEKTRTKDTTRGSVIEKDTTPEEAREMAEAAVAGDNPVIESEVAHADAKDAPATTTTEDGGKAASILEDLERGPAETVGEPGHNATRSNRSRSSSVTAEDVDHNERYDTPVDREGTAEEPLAVGETAEEPSAVEEETAEPLSKQETRHSTAASATTQTPATASSLVRSPTQQKKKNRFSALFSRNKKDSSSSNYVYREVGTPKAAGTEPTHTATREVDEEPETAHEADVTGITTGTQHTHSRPATVDERADTEPEDEEEPEPVVPDNRSITEIAATTPLPQPAYTEKTRAKHEKARKKQEYEDMIRKEKARRDAELLYKRDRIMNAYTGKQDFSKVPKPSRTKNFGKSIHTGSQKEGPDPVQHIVKSDKKAYKAEEATETHSRGSSIMDEHQEHQEEDSAPADMVALNLLLHGSGNEGNHSTAAAHSPVVAEEKPAVHSRQTSEAVVAEPSTADVTMSPTSTGVKKRKSVKKTGTTGTKEHRRKSSADAGLSPLTPVSPPASAPTSPTSPTSPTTGLKKRASVKSTKSTRDPAAPHKKEKSAESNILPDIQESGKSHRRVRSGDSNIVGEDHVLHLTGNKVETGLIKKPSTRSNRTSGTTRHTKRRSTLSTEPAKTSDGVAV